MLTFTELFSAYPHATTPAPQKAEEEEQAEEEKQQLAEKRAAAALVLPKVTKPAAPKVVQGW